MVFELSKSEVGGVRFCPRSFQRHVKMENGHKGPEARAGHRQSSSRESAALERGVGTNLEVKERWALYWAVAQIAFSQRPQAV
jgi:hypothetical protein